jgi:hypothetical protein
MASKKKFRTRAKEVFISSNATAEVSTINEDFTADVTTNGKRSTAKVTTLAEVAAAEIATMCGCKAKQSKQNKGAEEATEVHDGDVLRA